MKAEACYGCVHLRYSGAAMLRQFDKDQLEHGVAQHYQDNQAKLISDTPAEQLARSRPGERVEGPAPPLQGSAFHEG